MEELQLIPPSCQPSAGLTWRSFFSLSQLRHNPVRVTLQPDDSINLATKTLPSIWQDGRASTLRSSDASDSSMNTNLTPLVTKKINKTISFKMGNFSLQITNIFILRRFRTIIINVAAGKEKSKPLNYRSQMGQLSSCFLVENSSAATTQLFFFPCKPFSPGFYI